MNWVGPADEGRGRSVCAMHELSIMESALKMVLDQARQAKAGRILLIRLRVGALSGVVPEALELAFEALRSGTLAETAELHIDHVPARYWCQACAREFESSDPFGECPHCGQPSGDLRAGRELELASLDVE